MSLEQRLSAAFERGASDGGRALSGTERRDYIAWEFILQFEMGGLHGYLYNALPGLESARAAEQALQEVGLFRMANSLREAISLIDGHDTSSSPTTWEAILHRCDPNGRLDAIDAEIIALPNYSL